VGVKTGVAEQHSTNDQHPAQVVSVIGQCVACLTHTLTHCLCLHFSNFSQCAHVVATGVHAVSLPAVEGDNNPLVHQGSTLTRVNPVCRWKRVEEGVKMGTVAHKGGRGGRGGDNNALVHQGSSLARVDPVQKTTFIGGEGADSGGSGVV
jgi:hypothetical protein